MLNPSLQKQPEAATLNGLKFLKVTKNGPDNDYLFSICPVPKLSQML